MASRTPIYSNPSFEIESEDNQPVYTSSIKRGHHRSGDREVYTLVSPSPRTGYSYVHPSGDIIYRDTSFGGTGGEVVRKSDSNYYLKSDGPHYRSDVMPHYRTEVIPHYRSDGISHYRSDGIPQFKSDGTHYTVSRSDGLLYKSDGAHYKSDGALYRPESSYYHYSRSILPGRYYMAEEPGEIERLKKIYPASLRVVHPESSKHHTSQSSHSYQYQKRNGHGSSYAIETQPSHIHTTSYSSQYFWKESSAMRCIAVLCILALIFIALIVVIPIVRLVD